MSSPFYDRCAPGNQSLTQRQYDLTYARTEMDSQGAYSSLGAGFSTSSSFQVTPENFGQTVSASLNYNQVQLREKRVNFPSTQRDRTCSRGAGEVSHLMNYASSSLEHTHGLNIQSGTSITNLSKNFVRPPDDGSALKSTPELLNCASNNDCDYREHGTQSIPGLGDYEQVVDKSEVTTETRNRKLTAEEIHLILLHFGLDDEDLQVLIDLPEDYNHANLPPILEQLRLKKGKKATTSLQSTHGLEPQLTKTMSGVGDYSLRSWGGTEMNSDESSSAVPQLSDTNASGHPGRNTAEAGEDIEGKDDNNNCSEERNMFLMDTDEGRNQEPQQKNTEIKSSALSSSNEERSSSTSLSLTSSSMPSLSSLSSDQTKLICRDISSTISLPKKDTGISKSGSFKPFPLSQSEVDCQSALKTQAPSTQSRGLRPAQPGHVPINSTAANSTKNPSKVVVEHIIRHKVQESVQQTRTPVLLVPKPTLQWQLPGVLDNLSWPGQDFTKSVLAPGVIPNPLNLPTSRTYLKDKTAVSEDRPTPEMMYDYAAAPPRIFPHTCVLCTKEYANMKDWIHHLVGLLHLESSRRLRKQFPKWDGEVAPGPRPSSPKTSTSSSGSSSSSESLSPEHHYSPEGRRYRCRSRSSSPRGRFTRTSTESKHRSRSSSGSLSPQRRHNTEGRSYRSHSRSPKRWSSKEEGPFSPRRDHGRRSPQRRRRYETHSRRRRGSDSKSPPRRVGERHSPPRRISGRSPPRMLDRRRSPLRKAGDRRTQAWWTDQRRSPPRSQDRHPSNKQLSPQRKGQKGAESLAKKLLESPAAQEMSNTPEVNALVKSLAPVLWDELEKMLSSSPASSSKGEEHSLSSPSATSKRLSSSGPSSSSAERTTESKTIPLKVKLRGVEKNLHSNDIAAVVEQYGKTNRVTLYRSTMEATVQFEKEEDAEKLKSLKSISVRGTTLTVVRETLSGAEKLMKHLPKEPAASSVSTQQTPYSTMTEAFPPTAESQCEESVPSTAEKAQTSIHISPTTSANGSAEAVRDVNQDKVLVYKNKMASKKTVAETKGIRKFPAEVEEKTAVAEQEVPFSPENPPDSEDSREKPENSETKVEDSGVELKVTGVFDVPVDSTVIEPVGNTCTTPEATISATQKHGTEANELIESAAETGRNSEEVSVPSGSADPEDQLQIIPKLNPCESKVPESLEGPRVTAESGKASPPTMVKLYGVHKSLTHSEVLSAAENFGKTKSVVLFRISSEAVVIFERREDAMKLKMAGSLDVNGAPIASVREKETVSGEEKTLPQSTPTSESRIDKALSHSAIMPKGMTTFAEETNCGSEAKDILDQQTVNKGVSMEEEAKMVAEKQMVTTVSKSGFSVNKPNTGDSVKRLVPDKSKTLIQEPAVAHKAPEPGRAEVTKAKVLACKPEGTELAKGAATRAKVSNVEGEVKMILGKQTSTVSKSGCPVDLPDTGASKQKPLPDKSKTPTQEPVVAPKAAGPAKGAMTKTQVSPMQEAKTQVKDLPFENPTTKQNIKSTIPKDGCKPANSTPDLQPYEETLKCQESKVQEVPKDMAEVVEKTDLVASDCKDKTTVHKADGEPVELGVLQDKDANLKVHSPGYSQTPTTAQLTVTQVQGTALSLAEARQEPKTRTEASTSGTLGEAAVGATMPIRAADGNNKSPGAVPTKSKTKVQEPMGASKSKPKTVAPLKVLVCKPEVVSTAQKAKPMVSKLPAEKPPAKENVRETNNESKPSKSAPDVKSQKFQESQTEVCEHVELPKDTAKGIQKADVPYFNQKDEGKVNKADNTLDNEPMELGGSGVAMEAMDAGICAEDNRKETCLVALPENSEEKLKESRPPTVEMETTAMQAGDAAAKTIQKESLTAEMTQEDSISTRSTTKAPILPASSVSAQFPSSVEIKPTVASASQCMTAASKQRNSALICPTIGEMLEHYLSPKDIRCFRPLDMSSSWLPEGCKQVLISWLPTWYEGVYTERDIADLLSPFGFRKSAVKLYVFPQSYMAFVMMPTMGSAFRLLKESLECGIYLRGWRLNFELLCRRYLLTTAEFYVYLKKVLKCSVVDEAERTVLITNIFPREVRDLRQALKEFSPVSNFMPLLNKLFIEFESVEDAVQFGDWHSRRGRGGYHQVFLLKRQNLQCQPLAPVVKTRAAASPVSKTAGNASAVRDECIQKPAEKPATAKAAMKDNAAENRAVPPTSEASENQPATQPKATPEISKASVKEPVEGLKDTAEAGHQSVEAKFLACKEEMVNTTKKCDIPQENLAPTEAVSNKRTSTDVPVSSKTTLSENQPRSANPRQDPGPDKSEPYVKVQIAGPKDTTKVDKSKGQLAQPKVIASKKQETVDVDKSAKISKTATDKAHLIKEKVFASRAAVSTMQKLNIPVKHTATKRALPNEETAEALSESKASGNSGNPREKPKPGNSESSAKAPEVELKDQLAKPGAKTSEDLSVHSENRPHGENSILKQKTQESLDSEKADVTVTEHKDEAEERMEPEREKPSDRESQTQTDETEASVKALSQGQSKTLSAPESTTQEPERTGATGAVGATTETAVEAERPSPAETTTQREFAESVTDSKTTFGENIEKHLTSKKKDSLKCKPGTSPKLLITWLSVNNSFTEEDFIELLTPFGYQHKDHHIYVVPQARLAFVLMPTAKSLIYSITANKWDPVILKGTPLRFFAIKNRILMHPLWFYKSLMELLNYNMKKDKGMILFIKDISPVETRELREVLNKIGAVKNFLPLLNKVFIEFQTVSAADRLGVWCSLLKQPPGYRIQRLNIPYHSIIAPPPYMPENSLLDRKNVIEGAAIPSVKNAVPQYSVPPFWITLRNSPFVFPTVSPWFNIPDYSTVGITNDIMKASPQETIPTVMLTGLPGQGYRHEDVARLVWPYFLKQTLQSLYYNVAVLPLQRRAFVFFPNWTLCGDFVKSHADRPVVLKGWKIGVHLILQDMNPESSEELMYKSLMKWSNAGVPDPTNLEERLLCVEVSEVSVVIIIFVMKMVASITTFVNFLPLANRICIEMTDASGVTKVMEKYNNLSQNALTEDPVWEKVRNFETLDSLKRRLQGSGESSIDLDMMDKIPSKDTPPKVDENMLKAITVTSGQQRLVQRGSSVNAEEQGTNSKNSEYTNVPDKSSPSTSPQRVISPPPPVSTKTFLPLQQNLQTSAPKLTGSDEGKVVSSDKDEDISRTAEYKEMDIKGLCQIQDSVTKDQPATSQTSICRDQADCSSSVQLSKEDSSQTETQNEQPVSAKGAGENGEPSKTGKAIKSEIKEESSMKQDEENIKYKTGEKTTTAGELIEEALGSFKEEPAEEPVTARKGYGRRRSARGKTVENEKKDPVDDESTSNEPTITTRSTRGRKRRTAEDGLNETTKEKSTMTMRQTLARQSQNRDKTPKTEEKTLQTEKTPIVESVKTETTISEPTITTRSTRERRGGITEDALNETAKKPTRRSLKKQSLSQDESEVGLNPETVVTSEKADCGDEDKQEEDQPKKILTSAKRKYGDDADEEKSVEKKRTSTPRTRRQPEKRTRQMPVRKSVRGKNVTSQDNKAPTDELPSSPKASSSLSRSPSKLSTDSKRTKSESRTSKDADSPGPENQTLKGCVKEEEPGEDNRSRADVKVEGKQRREFVGPEPKRSRTQSPSVPADFKLPEVEADDLPGTEFVVPAYFCNLCSVFYQKNAEERHCNSQTHLDNVERHYWELEQESIKAASCE